MTIYEQHDKHFSHVSAYVITDAKGERVATIAFRFPKDSASRLWCYLHVIGVPMVRGSSTGYGYDKKSAAAHSAASYIPPEAGEIGAKLQAAIKDQGNDWDRDLRDAGFNVLHAV